VHQTSTLNFEYCAAAAWVFHRQDATAAEFTLSGGRTLQ